MVQTNQQNARKRSNEGLSRITKLTRDTFDADPSRGGSRGYPLWYRLLAIEASQIHGTEYAARRFKPSKQTLSNWLDRAEPYEMTGNKRRKLVGWDQLLLAIWLTAHPDSHQDEIAAFLANYGSGELYTQSTISRRLKELEYTRKKASIEAYQAFLPRNIRRRQYFFECPPPLGVFNVERRSLTDTDECAISLERTNRSRGVAHKSFRVRKKGHYIKGEKLTIIFTMEPGTCETTTAWNSN